MTDKLKAILEELGINIEDHQLQQVSLSILRFYIVKNLKSKVDK